MTTLQPSVGLPYEPQKARPLELSDLEEMHARHTRETWWARATLLALIFGMLLLNLWMTQRNYDALMADVDASRMAMSELHDRTSVRLDAVEKRLEAMEARLPPPHVAVTVP